MVAKIPLSRSRLITSFARASSFSESSLIAIPSLMVIFRVIGTSSGTTGRGGAIEGAGPRRIIGGAGRPIAGRTGGGPPAATAPPAAGRAEVGCMGRGSPGRREGTGRAGAGFGITACG